MVGRVAITGALIVVCGTTAAPDEPSLLPREVFLAPVERAHVRLAPDGTRVAYIRDVGTGGRVVVETVDRAAVRELAAPPGGAGVLDLAWSADGRVILCRAPADGGVHLVAFDPAGGEPRDLTPGPAIRASLIGCSAEVPTSILIGMAEGEGESIEVRRLDLESGEHHVVLERTASLVGAVGDAKLDVLVKLDRREDGSVVVHLRDAADAQWYELVRWSAEDADLSRVLGFAHDARVLHLVDSRRADAGALIAYAASAAGGPASASLFEAEGAEVGRVLFDPVTGNAQAAAAEGGRRRWKVLDPALAADLAFLGAVDPEADFDVIDRSADDTIWLVAFDRGDRPRAYHVYRRAPRAATLLFDDRPALAGIEFAPVEAVSFPARDGLTLHAYLTTPRGRAPRRLPLVVVVHDGPWSRDRFELDLAHQWLADRGYAVLAVNYRGSTGFGRQHRAAGNHQWAASMHDDLIDSASWAIDRKIAHPDRVAILGSGYGGYAAIGAIAQAPGFFAAAVAISPVSVHALAEEASTGSAEQRRLFERRVARLDDARQLEHLSPAGRAAAIREPLLVVVGGADRRSPIDALGGIVTAMQAGAVPVTVMVLPPGGSGRIQPESVNATLGVAEAFLAAHLGGRYEPLGEVLEQSSAHVVHGAEHVPGLPGR